MKSYEVVLTTKGKAIFKGGNIEPMKKMLIKITSATIKGAEEIFNRELNKTLGSSMIDYYELKYIGEVA